MLVIETRKLRDTQGYTSELFLSQTFVCFIFQQPAIFFRTAEFAEKSQENRLFSRNVITFARAYAKLGAGWDRDFDVQKFSFG